MAITRNPTNFNKFQFLNRETQFETGYIDLIHRQFDPTIARFISQDPVIEGQEHLSLYQYGWNNPILRSDPDGDCPFCPNLIAEGETQWNALKTTVSKVANDVGDIIEKALTFTDVNDATVLVTSLTRGKDAINIDGQKATTGDKAMAGVGIIVPIVSGSVAKKSISFISDRAVGAYKSLQGKFNEAHHIIQDAAVKDIPTYSKREAPTIHLNGSSKTKGTEHNLATQAQNNRRQLGDGGTYGAERRIAYRSLRAAGLTQNEAKEAIKQADTYFQSLGVTTSTTTRIPYKRP